MWGISALAMIAGFGVVLLAMALTAGWAAPVIGVAIVVVVAPLAIYMMTRESGEPGGEGTEEVGGRSGGKPSWLRKHWYE